MAVHSAAPASCVLCCAGGCLCVLLVLLLGVFCGHICVCLRLIRFTAAALGAHHPGVCLSDAHTTQGLVRQPRCVGGAGSGVCSVLGQLEQQPRVSIGAFRVVVYSAPLCLGIGLVCCARLDRLRQLVVWWTVCPWCIWEPVMVCLLCVTGSVHKQIVAVTCALVCCTVRLVAVTCALWCVHRAA